MGTSSLIVSLKVAFSSLSKAGKFHAWNLIDGVTGGFGFQDSWSLCFFMNYFNSLPVAVSSDSRRRFFFGRYRSTESRAWSSICAGSWQFYFESCVFVAIPGFQGKRGPISSLPALLEGLQQHVDGVVSCHDVLLNPGSSSQSGKVVSA